MPIVKYTASADNTITNDFEDNLSTRGTGSSMGSADILEAHSVFGRATTGSVELSRILIKFPISEIKADRTAGKIPASGDVNFVLKMYNSSHRETTPRNFDLVFTPVSADWEEGFGLDMGTYTDLTNDGIGSNWINANGTHSSASFTMSLQGGANKATMSGQSFTLTDSDGTSQTFTFNIANDTVTDGTIGMQSDSNTTDIINTIKLAINDSSLSLLDITASTITAVGDADSEMRLLIKQKSTGFAGNTSVDLSGVAHLSVLNSETGFTGGSGKWASVGGDYLDLHAVTQSFDTGFENINIDVTNIVEKWILGSAGGQFDNYGLGIRFSNTYEGYFSSSTGQDADSVIHNVEGPKISYYTKKFFGRTTEFFHARPVLEAQYSDQKKDNRGNFQISSSVLPAADNLNKIYFYNYSRGVLSDIAGDAAAQPVVKLYQSTATVPVGTEVGFLRGSDNNAQTSISATRESKGVYSIQIAATSSVVDATYPYLVDVWSYGGEEFYTGSAITPLAHNPSAARSMDTYVVSIKNLKRVYRENETVRFRTYVRKKDWSPTIYSVAQKTPENLIIEDAIYKVIRVVDDLEVIAYGTGSVKYTSLSYDSSGNYFDLDMSLFEKGYQYGIKLSFYDAFTGDYSEQPYLFKFRVE